MDTSPNDKPKSLGWGYDLGVERQILAELLTVYGYDAAEAEAIRGENTLSNLSSVRLAFVAQRLNIWSMHQAQTRGQLGSVLLLAGEKGLRFLVREVYMPEVSLRMLRLDEDPATQFWYNFTRAFNPLSGDVPCAVYPIDLDHWALAIMGIDEYPPSSNVYPTKEAAIEAGTAFLRRKIEKGWAPGGIAGPSDAFAPLPVDEVERLFNVSYQAMQERQRQQPPGGQVPPPPPAVVGLAARRPPPIEGLFPDEDMPDGEDEPNEPPPTPAELRTLIRGAICYMVEAREQPEPAVWARFGFNESDAIMRLDVCREVLELMPLLRDIAGWLRERGQPIPTAADYPDLAQDVPVLATLLQPRDREWENLFSGPLTDEDRRLAAPYREDPALHPYHLAARLVPFRTSLDDRMLRMMVLTTYL